MSFPTSTPPPPPPGGYASVPPPTSPAPEPYPVRFEVEYPERLGRLSTAFRLLLLIPAWMFASLVAYILYAAMPAAWIAVFLRRKYPDWLFHAVSGVAGYNARLMSYGALLTDRFPSFESAGSPVHLEFDDPPNGHLSRWRVFSWKFALLVPHFIVLGFLMIAVFVVVVIAWFAILFTGKYPRGMFAFVTGIQRWYHRTFAYFASFNDRYPPYALSADAGPASGASTVASGVFGVLLAGGATAGIVAAVIVGAGYHSETVDYADLQDGAARTELYIFDGLGGELIFQLTGAHDPGDDLVGVLDVGSRDRVVVFEWFLGTVGRSQNVSGTPARLDYRDGNDEETANALFVAVGDATAPLRVDRDEVVVIRAVFVIPQDAEPTELRWRPGFQRGFKYVFE